MTTQQIISKLDLKPHPEGGYYRETFRSQTMLKLQDGRERSASTAIYYMLVGDDKSHFHRVASDETWLFHQGETIEILIVDPNGMLEIVSLGNDLEAGDMPQFTVPANLWFGARLKFGKSYSLASCIVAPGFEFADFVMATGEDFTGFESISKSILETMIKK